MVFFIHEPQKTLIWGEKNESCNLCFVNDSIKLCYVFIPKNATQSMKHLTSTNNKTLYTEHFNTYQNYNKMIIIRDPMDRIVSTYNEVIKVASHITRKYDFYKFRHDIEKSFDLFLDTIKFNYFDGHICPQYLYIKLKGLKIQDFDDIFLFENLNRDIPIIKQKYNLSNNVKFINIGNSHIKSKLKQIVYKYETKIRDIYYNDFELYNYAKSIQ